VRSVELSVGLQIIKLTSSHKITMKFYIRSTMMTGKYYVQDIFSRVEFDYLDHADVIAKLLKLLNRTPIIMLWSPDRLSFVNGVDW